MFNTVSVVGTGLLGGSLARDLRRLKLANRLIGVCRSKTTAAQALEHGVVDEICPIEQAVKDADLIVMATPMQVMVPLLASVQAHIPSDAIITDVGSVKSDLYTALFERTPELLSQFVLAHPIAGGEHSGVQSSRTNLFAQKHVIVTETPQVNPAMTQRIIFLWRALGAKVMSMSLTEHDAIFAKTSHLPHVIAFALVNYLSQQCDREQLFELAAAGFYDFTRIASSDAEMWRDICITNQAQVLTAMDGFIDQLTRIRDHVVQADQEAILDYFGRAKQARDEGLINKAEAMKARKA